MGDYTAKEFCDIVKTCAKYGVSRIRLSSDIEVEFKTAGGDPESLEESSRGGGNTTSYLTQDQDSGDTQVFDLSEMPVSLSDEDRETLEDVRKAQLLTDAPLAFEQEMIDVFLETPARIAYDDEVFRD